MGVIAASGSACCAGGDPPSHVLLAQGESPQHARCAVRFSLGRRTTSAEIDAALSAAPRRINRNNPWKPDIDAFFVAVSRHPSSYFDLHQIHHTWDFLGDCRTLRSSG
ncbi:hypothetical protein THIX_90104 [Thiomonas sp. X19]|nr:hypothetical protein THIX_90104 [Thiomonas sp. X19]